MISREQFLAAWRYIHAPENEDRLVKDIIAFCNWQWSVDLVNWTTVTSSNQVFENSGELTLVDGSRKTDRVRAVYSVRGSLLAALVAEPKVFLRPRTRILP